MMGAPGMRSVILPARAFLDASRLAFLLRLRVVAGRKALALFDASGG